jgi:Reverse transcriptase (RNA-dependent DNA polymerase)
MVFDVKPDFTRKARLVAGGHMTDPPSAITYASVVSRESVRIAFLLAALNNLDVLAADIGNAYLNARTREKVYIICGKEFGDDNVGKKAIIVRALYGLKSSGAAWRSCLAEVLRDQLGYQPCRADNDVWLRAAQRSDGSRYYEYVLVYTDDILSVSCDPNAVLTSLDQHFLLKPGSIGPPTQYLGASVGKYKFPGGDECWYMGSDQYVKEAIRNVSTWLEKRDMRLKTKASSVLPSNYRPELDVSPLCSDEDANYYMQQIGVLRWAVELGRIDIAAEVSMLAAFNAAPRRNHLLAVMHIFAWLKTHERSKVVLDPSYVEHVEVEKPDWSDFYKDAKELLPPDMPEPLGKPVQMTTFVDSDHAGDKVTRRSRTGVLVFLNRAPIVWFSKKQNSIETSSFGSEFTAMKQGVEISEGLRYKLRMMGVPLDGCTHIKADNMSVIKNTSVPESMLKKKSNSIAYHYVRERAASGAIAVSYEPTQSNLADMLTKAQPGPTRKALVSHVLF